MSQRLTQFDILKGIGILCVLLGHTVLSGYPKELIYGFHMPLFFFCSGVFFKQRSLKETFIKSVKQLLVPYLFFFSILQGSYFLIELKATHSLSLSIANVLADLTEPLNEDSHYYLTIWFLICLFMIRIVYAALAKHVDNKVLLILTGGGKFARPPYYFAILP